MPAHTYTHTYIAAAAARLYLVAQDAVGVVAGHVGSRYSRLVGVQEGVKVNVIDPSEPLVSSRPGRKRRSATTVTDEEEQQQLLVSVRVCHLLLLTEIV